MKVDWFMVMLAVVLAALLVSEAWQKVSITSAADPVAAGCGAGIHKACEALKEREERNKK